MGWKRIKGRRYFYESVREGSRVRSVHRGGEFGELVSSFIRADADERRLNREDEREERKAWDEIDRALDQLAGESRRLADLVLTANGYHRHNRGEWRLKRVPKD